MRTLIGAFLTLTALTPAVLTPVAAGAQIRGDAGIQPQAEDRVDMGPPGRPASRGEGPRGDGPRQGGGDRGDRPTFTRGPDRADDGRDRRGPGSGQWWNGDRTPRPQPDAPRPDRAPGQPWTGDRPDRGGFAGRSGGYDRPPPRPADRGDDRRDRDWTRSRLDRRDQWWAQSRFEDRAAWNRGWRADRRYDWNGYREGNRGAYRLPRYYAPYGWGGGYRRFGIGVSLQAPLWRRNYWIADPYAYRLPEAYGPYRWVRYYDDALLVDLRSGLVVDAVYGIFW